MERRRLWALFAGWLFTSTCHSPRLGAAAEGGVLWSFGGGTERVLSGPSRDAAGNLHVMIVRTGGEPTRHEGVFLVKLDSSGRALRRTKIVDARRESPANPWNRWALRAPVLGSDGGAWLIHAGEVVRVDAKGTVKWRAALPHPYDMPEGNVFRRPDFGGALSADDVLFLTTPSYVLALSAAGQWLWTAARAPKPQSETSPALRNSGAPVVGRDGTVFATCAGCVEGRPRDSGIAAFDPKTGALRWLVGVAGPEPRFGSPAITEGGTVLAPLMLGADPVRLVAATAQGVASHARFPALGFADSPVAPVIGPRGKLAAAAAARLWIFDSRSGEGRPVDVGGNVAVAVASENVVWVLVQAPGQDRSRGRLLSLNWAGQDVQVLDAPTLATAMDFQIAPGVVYAVTEDARLIAIRSPRASAAAGAWPTAGGDEGNRRRAAAR